MLLLIGYRLSEIQTLRWEHIKDDCIELPDAKNGERAVPLGSDARTVLLREDGNPSVIAGRLLGTYFTDLQRPWRRIRERADLKNVRIHDLGHSFVSRALAPGEGLTMIGIASGRSTGYACPASAQRRTKFGCCFMRWQKISVFLQ